jgi:hypothetical protein
VVLGTSYCYDERRNSKVQASTEKQQSHRKVNIVNSASCEIPTKKNTWVEHSCNPPTKEVNEIDAKQNGTTLDKPMGSFSLVISKFFFEFL